MAATPTTRERSTAVRSLAAALALTLLACDPVEPARPDAQRPAPAPSGAVCPPGSSSTYASFGRAFFDAHCQRCHASSVVGASRLGAPSSATYDDLPSIRRKLAEIDARAAAGPLSINTDMPRGAAVPLPERQELGEWLACGAP